MKILSTASVVGLAAAALLTTATTASAAPARPDTACQKAGMSTLRSLGLLDDVARDGLPISLAVEAGVTVRSGARISGVPNPIPLSVVLADHRAGDSSLFVYPWC
jgi:hypothetical protein